MDYRKWDIISADLDPTQGSEIKKTRPCLIISPTIVNSHLRTVIVAPMTSVIRSIPTRLKVKFDNINGEICFDQIRTVDKSRAIKKLGKLDVSYRRSANKLLANLFEEP